MPLAFLRDFGYTVCGAGPTRKSGADPTQNELNGSHMTHSHTSPLTRLAALLCLLLLLAAGGKPAFATGQQTDYDPNYPEDLRPEHLTCSSAIVVEAESGEVIFEKNADSRIYPASTTKIMTIYLGLLAGELDRDVFVSASAMDIPADSSVIPLSYGEVLKFRDVLYSTMLMSGNEGANVIAETVSGNIDNFVALMNAAASDFGCTATHFANPHGLSDDWHYSTARDMANLARIAMRNETFRDIVSQTEYSMPADNIYNARTLRTNNRFLRNASGNEATYYPEGIGIKTGFTSAAGYCYVGAAVRNGVTLISCVYHASSDANRYIDTIKLLEYGFTQFTGVSIAELYRRNPRVVDIAHYAQDDANLGKLTLALNQISSEGSDKIVTSASNIDYLSHHLNDITITDYTRAFSAPIQEGDVMGTMTYYDEQGLPTVYELLATRSIARREQLFPTIDEIIAMTINDPNPFPRFTVEFALFYIILPLLLIVLLIRLIHRIRHRKNRRKKRIRNVEPQERYFQ